MSTTPAHLHVAGTDRIPLNRDRPAYDLSLMEPGVNRLVRRERDYEENKMNLEAPGRFVRIHL